jgi:hypothetical protein
VPFKLVKVSRRALLTSSNSFATLASPAIAPSIVPPFRESSILAGSKCSHSPSSSLPIALKALPANKPRWQDSDHSVFNVLNIFQSQWFIHRKHLIANVLSATKDSDGQLTWVDFMPVFHTVLIKCMCTLLSSDFTVAHGK